MLLTNRFIGEPLAIGGKVAVSQLIARRDFVPREPKCAQQP